MSDDARTPGEWLAEYASRMDVALPNDDVIDTLLELAGVAAHASERTAAPIACWLAGQAGLSPTDALTLAREI
jgi:hypothetical protein